MNTSSVLFATRTFLVPTPKHASQPTQTIKKNFIELLRNNRAALLAIKQAAAGECVLVVNPSRNPHANAVFAAVLNSMVEFHRNKLAAAQPATEATNDAPPMVYVHEQEMEEEETVGACLAKEEAQAMEEEINTFAI